MKRPLLARSSKGNEMLWPQQKASVRSKPLSVIPDVVGTEGGACANGNDSNGEAPNAVGNNGDKTAAGASSDSRGENATCARSSNSGNEDAAGASSDGGDGNAADA